MSKWKWHSPVAWIFYLLIVFEIIYMVSPFAMYYYSSYGIGLNFLNQSALTSWLTGFFLPHYSQTSSLLLTWLPALGYLLLIFGTLMFLVCAGQIYYAKFMRRGAVMGGIYRVVRHPQYTAFAFMGLGVLLVWPRFTVLVMFVIMLFVYYFLARHEEKECLDKFGEDYAPYLTSTEMFLPGRFSVANLVPKIVTEKFSETRLLLIIVLPTIAVVVSLAFLLRAYSISTISTYYSANSATIAVARLPETEIAKAIKIAESASDVSDRLKAKGYGKGSTLLNYLLPEEWQLVDIPIEVLPKDSKDYGHHTPKEFAPGLYKILFTRALVHDKDTRGPDIISGTYAREPIVVVKVNTTTGKVLEVLDPPAHVPWGDISTPMF